MESLLVWCPLVEQPSSAAEPVCPTSQPGECSQHPAGGFLDHRPGVVYLAGAIMAGVCRSPRDEVRTLRLPASQHIFTSELFPRFTRNDSVIGIFSDDFCAGFINGNGFQLFMTGEATVVDRERQAVGKV